MPKDADEGTSWIDTSWIDSFWIDASWTDSFWIEISWIDTRYTSYFQAHPNLYDDSREGLQIFSIWIFQLPELPCTAGTRGHNLIYKRAFVGPTSSAKSLSTTRPHVLGNALCDGRNCPA